MNPQHTMGPWLIQKGRSVRPFYVARDVSPGPSFTHWEQLQAEEGGIATFETEDEARAAIAKATGGAA